MFGRVLRRNGQYAFGLVFLLALLSFGFAAAAPDEPWARLVSVLIQGSTLLAAVWIADSRRMLVILAFAVVAAGVGLGIQVVAAGNDETLGSLSVVTGLLVALAPPAIASSAIREMRRLARVTPQIVFAALTIYILVGMFFAFVQQAIGHLGSGPVFANGADPSPQNILYFSFVTLTTTGYGDFTAATEIGRTFAVVEALLGQLYLVTVVALLVANVRRPALSDGA